MIMNMDDLKIIINRSRHRADNAKVEGNMCYYCARHNCKYVLDGDLYYGQEVGVNTSGNPIIYECPKYILPRTLATTGTDDHVLPYMLYYYKDVFSFIEEAKQNPVYRFYSNY